MNVAGIPQVLITDKYKAYSPAVKKLERTLYGKGSVKHIMIRPRTSQGFTYTAEYNFVNNRQI